MFFSSLLVCNLLTLFAFFGFLSRLQTFPSFLDEDIDEVTDAGPLSAPARSDEAASYAEQEDEEKFRRSRCATVVATPILRTRFSKAAIFWNYLCNFRSKPFTEQLFFEFSFEGSAHLLSFFEVGP